jgi:pyruvate/2-oxoglutarate dehydrogenase complex dihydrolipoamide acyltransferase (E2) component
VADPAAAGSLALSPRQRAVGAVVTRSHRTVPDAFVAVAVPCDGLLERLRASNAEHAGSVGLPEAVLKALAGLRPAFPAFFGWLDGEDRLRLPGPETDIGITIDVGTGLFVPVVRDAGALGLLELADRLAEFRYKAMRQSFQDSDLAGGQLSVSLAMDADVLVSVPIIQSPQVCMISLAAVRTEVVLDEHDRPGRRRHLTVGLAYDHRVINGREAVQFLAALRSALRPEELGL